MLKGFNELVQIDVLPFCDKRKAKDDNGKPIEVPYLPWAKCKMLLHENGASEVYFVPLKNETGGYLFSSKENHYKKSKTPGGCFFFFANPNPQKKIPHGKTLFKRCLGRY